MRYVRVMPRPSASPLPPPDAQRVAVLAKVDPRTVTTYLSGRRATTRASAALIERALRKIGRADLVRSTAAA